MRYATAIVTTLALGAGVAAFAPKADAGVVIGVGIPAPALAAPGYYPYAPMVPEVGVAFGPAWYGHGYWGPAYRGPVYYRPGWGGYYRGGYYHGVRGHGWYHR